MKYYKSISAKKHVSVQLKTVLPEQRGRPSTIIIVKSLKNGEIEVSPEK